MKYISKKGKIIFSLLLILTIAFILPKTHIISIFNKADDLVNINKLSPAFMDNYFKEISDIQEEDKDNILIVISKKNLKENYGAKKIIKAPNYQYYLVYNSKEEMINAQKNIKANNPSLEVSNNIKYEISEDEVLAYDFNSWGFKAMGIDTLLEEIKNKELNDITVAIVDTGLDTDLFNQNYPGRLADYYNVVEPDDPMSDTNGHGTHIAGTIAESTPDNVKIMPIKVAVGRTFHDIDVIAGVNYIAYGAKADVVNMSFGSANYSAPSYHALEAANKENITCVAAAGNEKTNQASYPAGNNNTISVAALDSNKEQAEFSNSGDTIMFSAPGVDIKSINGTMSGTSMATPHIVSSVAILKSINKKITLKDSITILRRYAEDLGEEGWDTIYGYGFVNFKDAKVCDNKDCDEFKIFTKTDHDNLDELIKDYKIISKVSDYNFGTINNILETEVNVTLNNDKKMTYTLYDLPNVKITDYDPNKIGKQKVNVEFNTPLGETISDTFEVNQPYEKESVWNYKVLEDNKIELTGFKDTEFSGNRLYIPEEIDGYTIVAIADREDDAIFSRNVAKHISELHLPSTLTKVGNKAFYYLKEGLNYVKSTADNLEVGDEAFYEDESLLILDANLSYVGDNSFYNTGNLGKIRFSDSLSYIGTSAFKNAFDDVSLTIPSSLKGIGEKPFQKADLKEVNFEDDVENIPDYMFYGCEKIEKLTLPSNLKTIGDSAFYSAFYVSAHYWETIFPKSITFIGENNFNDRNFNKTKFLTYNNTYVKNYFDSHNIGYNLIDPIDVKISGYKEIYKAFEKINKNDLDIELTYNENPERKEKITDNIEIKYKNGNDSFRYGDTSFKVIAYNTYGYKIEKDISVKVEKADANITYNSESQSVVYDGKEHGITLNVTNPSNAKVLYMDKDGQYTLEEMPKYKEIGKYVIKFKIYIDDNYTDIKGEETLEIYSEANNIVVKDYEGIYDGKEHTISIDMQETKNCELSYSTNNKDFNLTSPPKYKDVGEYSIYYKASCQSGEITDSKKVKIYGIKAIAKPLVLKNNIIVTKNNSFNFLTNNIPYFAKSIEFNHYHKNDLITSDSIKTRDKVSIKINGLRSFDYNISLVGDLTEDGKITADDYILVRNHIMKSQVINDNVIFYAGDINKDDKITSADYVKIRKHIMGKEIIKD